MAGDDDNIISIRGLKNQFGSQVIHDGLDLDVKRGEVLGIVGGSGTGKSVLLRTIIGLNKPRAGDIKVFGENLAKLPDDVRREWESHWGGSVSRWRAVFLAHGGAKHSGAD